MTGVAPRRTRISREDSAAARTSGSAGSRRSAMSTPHNASSRGSPAVTPGVQSVAIADEGLAGPPFERGDAGADRRPVCLDRWPVDARGIQGSHVRGRPGHITEPQRGAGAAGERLGQVPHRAFGETVPGGTSLREGDRQRSAPWRSQRKLLPLMPGSTPSRRVRRAPREGLRAACREARRSRSRSRVTRSDRTARVDRQERARVPREPRTSRPSGSRSRERCQGASWPDWWRRIAARGDQPVRAY